MSFNPIDLLPIGLLILFVFGSKRVPKAEGFNQDYLSIRTCKSLRGVMAIAIVYHHLAQKSLLQAETGSPMRIGFLVVSVFFFLSGYGLQKSHMRSEQYQKGFLLRRIPQVLFPYIIVTALFWLMYAADGKVWSFKDVILSIVHGDPIVSFSWYIINILIFYVAFWLLMVLFRKKNLLMIIGAVVWFAAYAAFCEKMNYPSYWYSSSHLLIIGMIWAVYEDKILEFIKKRYALLFTVSLILFAGLYFIKTFYSDAIPFKAAPLILTMAVSLLFVICIILYSLKVRFGNRIMEFLGDCSLEIYLIQGIFIMGLRGNRIYIENELLWAFLSIAGSVALGYVLHILFAKMLRGYRKLIKTEK